MSVSKDTNKRMNFRTEIKLRRSNFDIDLARKGFSAGSCFAEHMAGRLEELKFGMVSNPFGVMFNPASVADELCFLAEGRRFAREDLTADGELWFSWRCHGDLAECVPERALARMNEAAERGEKALKEADYVILTFGTAWVYELADGSGVVANCHKQPAEMFRRRRLSVEEIVKMYKPLLTDGVLSGKRVVMSVSPVRHLSDGFEENSLSKALLRVAIAELAEQFDNVDYFPAFEIVNDDLRDYRFYAADMAHPSEMAVEYVWERFREVYMSERTKELADRIGKVRAAMRHRVMKPDSEAAARFMAAQLKQVERLASELPHLDFGEEKNYFASNGVRRR